MELKFKRTACPCLRKVVTQVNTQEQTQELRLPDAMPDIGKVLGCWGQILIRSKEWHGNSMTVSGGVMAWVLYLPEDGTLAKNLDAWIPFQMKWDFPQTERDCAICIQPQIKNMDARGISARKLMLRANISILGEALEPTEVEIPQADAQQEDIQLLRNTYMMVLPREAGEKNCQLEEELVLPTVLPAPDKILRYDLTPQIYEQKVLAGRLVFKGNCTLSILYISNGGDIRKWTAELPFSQYAELDRDYSSATDSRIHMLMTGLDLNMDEQQRLQLKCTMSAQFVLYETVMAELIEDAYSTSRKVEPMTESLSLPVLLDRTKQSVSFQQKISCQTDRILDVCVYTDHPQKRIQSETLELCVPCFSQVLYLDESGAIQSAVSRSEDSVTIFSDPENGTEPYLLSLSDSTCVQDSDGVFLSTQVELDVLTFGNRGNTVVTGLEVGEPVAHCEDRPSLIIKRAGTGGLWQLAKACGSTVEQIQKANDLQGEPMPDRMLLIPIA